MLTVATFKRYPDRCYAVVIGDRRGPCGNAKTTAWLRYCRSGLIADASTDKSTSKLTQG